MESYKSLKLVRNLTGIIVPAIRVIDCLDALSGCIISLWLQPGLGQDPRAKWLKSKRNQAQSEWAEPVIYDKIQQFHYTRKSGGGSREESLYKLCTESGRTERKSIKWNRMMEWAICWMTVYDGLCGRVVPLSIHTHPTHWLQHCQANIKGAHLPTDVDGHIQRTHVSLSVELFKSLKLEATPWQHPCCE